MEFGTWLPLICWAQTTPADPSAPVAAPPVVSVSYLALRRWYGSLTLSSPDPLPNRFGLWAWLLGLAALLFLAILAQGPARALGQLLDLSGQARLVSTAIGRLRRSARLVAILLGTTVLSWTASQALSYHKSERLDELFVLKATKSLREIATEQGILAALTPLRDLCGLGDNMPLLVGISVILFKLTADRWGSGGDNPLGLRRPTLPPWLIVYWGGTGLYAMYRVANMILDPDGLPRGTCLFVEAGVVPALMAISDGLLLAWVLTELKQADLGADPSAEGLGLVAIIPGVPAATLGCLLALPARYVATGTWLVLSSIPKLAVPWVRIFVNGWGLVGLQGVAIVFAGIVGVSARPGNPVLGAFAGYGRLIRAEGGRVVATLLLAGLACGASSGLAYLLVLALPPQPWVLSAADSYAHYATLPIGMVTLAALVELGARSVGPETRNATG